MDVNVPSTMEECGEAGMMVMQLSKRVEQKSGDSDAVDPSLITSSSSINGQQHKLCISNRSMFALLSACVLISVGAYVSIKAYYNPASARDPIKTTTASMILADDIIDIAEPSNTRQDPSLDDAGNNNSAQINNGCNEDGEKWFKLEITTDNAGNETSWELEWMGDGKWRTFSVSKPHESKKEYVIKLCIPPAEYRFVIRDAEENGMCCGDGFGSYAGYLRGEKIFESPVGDEDWGERVHTFTLPASGSTTMTTDVPSTSPTKSSITFFPTAPPNTSTPTIPPMQESASPTLSSAEGKTLFPTNRLSSTPSLGQSQVPTAEPTNPPSPLLTAEQTNLPSPLATTEPTNPPSPLVTTEPSNPPSLLATTEPSNPPSSLPTPLSTLPPTMTPSPPPTPPPTDLPEDTVTKIFFVADTPYSDEERYNLMPNHIDQLEDDGDFVVHLGDLMYAVTDRCREGAYSIAAEVLQKAKMPTFVLPGDNDINDCPSIQHGEDMWMKYFHLFDEKHWTHSFDLTRWGQLNESFGFLHKRVLFLGLNMVGGTPYSWTEKTNRHKEHLEQVKALFDENEGNFDVIVLMKHAIPRYPHSDFFGDGDSDGLFIDMIRRLGKPTIHVHGDWHSYYEVEGEFGIDNYVRISLDGESVAPPLSVTIDVSKPNPITVSRRQNNLKVDCCANGWPSR